jgi:hypothetical protein
MDAFDFEHVEVGGDDPASLARHLVDEHHMLSACCLQPVEIDGAMGTFCPPAWRGGCGKYLKAGDIHRGRL